MAKIFEVTPPIVHTHILGFNLDHAARASGQRWLTEAAERERLHQGQWGQPAVPLLL